MDFETLCWVLDEGWSPGKMLATWVLILSEVEEGFVGILPDLCSHTENWVNGSLSAQQCLQLCHLLPKLLHSLNKSTLFVSSRVLIYISGWMTIVLCFLSYTPNSSLCSSSSVLKQWNATEKQRKPQLSPTYNSLVLSLILPITTSVGFMWVWEETQN